MRVKQTDGTAERAGCYVHYAQAGCSSVEEMLQGWLQWWKAFRPVLQYRQQPHLVTRGALVQGANQSQHLPTSTQFVVRLLQLQLL